MNILYTISAMSKQEETLGYMGNFYTMLDLASQGKGFDKKSKSLNAITRKHKKSAVWRKAFSQLRPKKDEIAII